jgi:hypothetical protein
MPRFARIPAAALAMFWVAAKCGVGTPSFYLVLSVAAGKCQSREVQAGIGTLAAALSQGLRPCSL